MTKRIVTIVLMSALFTILKLFESRALHAMAVMLVCGSSTLQAVEVNKTDSIVHAVKVLKDIETDQSKEWAVEQLRNAAENDTMAYAMNVLGLAYMSGAGVEKDSTLAISWLEKAVENGYSEACHNLGIFYKDGKCGVRQDFVKAYNAFQQGATAGSVTCKYDVGFMLYKGLGCQQDYVSAAEWFRQGAEANNSASLYMLGLCYRNGYGVQQDTVQARQLLNRSALLSFRPAIEELCRPYPENYLHETNESVPATMPDIAPEVNDTSLIYGRYQGFIVMYDWSGRYIIGEKPVTVQIDRYGVGKALGVMVLGGDSVDFKADVTPDGRLLFSDGRLLLNERYNPGRKVKYKMESATLDVWQDRVLGRLCLYSLKLKEPERPMYMELSRNTLQNDILTTEEERFTRIYATPNPFDNDFTATFELKDPCVPQVRIFDQSGVLVYSSSLGQMESGRHQVNLMPNVKKGTYVLNIKAGTHVLRTIIVKKGGA